MTTFQQRALTATVFAAVMLTGLFWNETSFFLLFFIISMGCLWEFLKLTIAKSLTTKIITLLGGFTLWISIYIVKMIWIGVGSWNLNRTLGWGLDNSYFMFWLGTGIKSVFTSFILFPFILMIVELFSKSEKPFQNVGISILGIIYTILPFQLFHFLTREFNGNFSFDTFHAIGEYTPYIVAGILFLTWANDTFAYLIGSRIGKTPLLPRISPKKTWEGTIGGAVMCILTGIVISFFFKELPLRDWAVVGGIVAIFGTIGDLVESMLKRSVGVKDSGSFMPGHGGFLDRFDAFIFAIPFVFLYLVIIK